MPVLRCLRALSPRAIVSLRMRRAASVRQAGVWRPGVWAGLGAARRRIQRPGSIRLQVCTRIVLFSPTHGQLGSTDIAGLATPSLHQSAPPIHAEPELSDCCGYILRLKGQCRAAVAQMCVLMRIIDASQGRRTASADAVPGVSAAVWRQRLWASLCSTPGASTSCSTGELCCCLELSRRIFHHVSAQLQMAACGLLRCRHISEPNSIKAHLTPHRQDSQASRSTCVLLFPLLMLQCAAPAAGGGQWRVRRRRRGWRPGRLCRL